LDLAMPFFGFFEFLDELAALLGEDLSLLGVVYKP